MNLVEKVRELEMALCHANGKLNSIQDFCETEQDAWYDETKNSMDNCSNYELLQGRVEFAEEILDYLEEEE